MRNPQTVKLDVDATTMTQSDHNPFRSRGLALISAGSALAIALAGCGSNTAASSKSHTSTTLASAPSVTTPTTATSPTSTGPTGGPVPSGFDPLSFTAVSANDYWLLGTTACNSPVCTSIARTTDGGTHFQGIPAPSAPVSTSTSSTDAINTLRFADPSDGYVYFSPASQTTHPFFTTHDGGATWTAQSIGDVLDFASSGGYAYAVVASCASGTCNDLHIERSAVGSDKWSSLALPTSTVASPLVALTAHGSSIWLSASVNSNSAHAQLMYSSDDGSTFTSFASPCTAGLGGTITASSSSVLWAICPTGMMAQGYRSTDGGTHWAQINAGELVNSSVIAPASDTVAVIEPTPDGGLLRTTDGGQSFTKVLPAANDGSRWSYVGFTTPSVGSALRQTGTPGSAGSVPSQQLWRTTDGGATWTGPVTI